MKKPAKPFVPVPAGTQRRKHQRQLARMQHFQPLTFSQQRQQHRAAQHKALVAHQHHAKKATKARKWSPDSDVALCSARAVAEAIRIMSGTVVDPLALYWSTASDPDEGQTISDALSAAQRQFAEQFVERDRVRMHPVAGLDLDQALALVERRPVSVQRERNPAREFRDGQLRLGHALILGLALPEPHAVTVGPDGTWWSWGEPYAPEDFPGAVIEEAWAVQWLP